MPGIVDADMPFNRRIRIENFEDGGLSIGPRRIEVYLPRGYEETEERYPVIYFGDGGNVFSRPGATMSVDLAYDQLIDEELIKPAIFVAIGLASIKTRVESYTPTTQRGGGGLGGYCRFVVELVKPYIDSHYRTQPEPASTGIAGYSLSASAAFIMAYTHPETFGMAGCMSAAWWSDGQYPLKLLTEGDGQKKAIRFWLDSGGGEYGVWLEAVRIYNQLERQGWIAGDDLAAYFDYPADHTFTDGGGRMREMLHFLLGKSPYQLQTYRLVCAAKPEAEKMDLGSGFRGFVGAEAWYKNGFRLTRPQPGILVNDTNVATLDAHDPILLQGVSQGETTISSTYQGHTALLQVVNCDPEMLFHDLPCPPTVGAPKATDDLVSKFDLPYDIVDENQIALARFGVWHDAQYLHIAVSVLDDSVAVEPGKMPWEQDAVEVNLDVRPEADLRNGSSSYDNSLSFYMNASIAGEQISIHSPESNQWLRVLPAGIQGSCATVPGGYNAVLSVPISFLQDRHKNPGKVFRLNVRVNSVDVIGGPSVETCWQLDWQKFYSPMTTGIFITL